MPIVGVVPLLDAIHSFALEPGERRSTSARPHPDPNPQQRRSGGECFAAWQSGYTGAGIGVALIDSGVSSHPDLNGGSSDFARRLEPELRSGRPSANDQYGHGTHIAGLIAGNGASSTGSEVFARLSKASRRRPTSSTCAFSIRTGGHRQRVIAAIGPPSRSSPCSTSAYINLSLGRPVYESYTLDPVCQAVEPHGRTASWSWSRPATTAAISPPTATAPSPRPATILT